MGTIFPQVPLSASMSPVRLHSSNPNLCAELVDYQPPVSRLLDSVEYAEYASDYIKLQEEFCTIAQKGLLRRQQAWVAVLGDIKVSLVKMFFCFFSVHSLLKSAFNTVAIEKEKIKQILANQEQSDPSAQINSLRKSLSQVTNSLTLFLCGARYNGLSDKTHMQGFYLKQSQYSQLKEDV